MLLATWHGTPVAVKEFVSKKRPGGHSRTASQLLSDMQKVRVCGLHVGKPASAARTLQAATQLYAAFQACAPCAPLFAQEAALMARMRHPHVVSLIGLTSRPPCLVTEYCPLGSLADVLRKACSDPKWAAQLTWRRRLNMVWHAAVLLQTLHAHALRRRAPETAVLPVCRHPCRPWMLLSG